jgi:hypothetical protein
MWEEGHAIARGNARRVVEGLVPLVHPPISCFNQGQLILLAEERRNELMLLLDELMEVERVLGIANM